MVLGLHRPEPRVALSHGGDGRGVGGIGLAAHLTLAHMSVATAVREMVSAPFRTRRRLRRLRLVASDVDWSVGRGPEVRGPIAALLLLVTGRSAAHGALTGDGAAQLATRG